MHKLIQTLPCSIFSDFTYTTEMLIVLDGIENRNICIHGDLATEFAGLETGTMLIISGYESNGPTKKQKMVRDLDYFKVTKVANRREQNKLIKSYKEEYPEYFI